MTNEPDNVPRQRAIVEVSPRTKALVEENMPPDAEEQVKRETEELVEVAVRKAQAEATKAGEFARENYLEAIRNIRTELESSQLFDPERIEYSFKLMQMDAEQNWDAIVKEVTDFGERLNEAAAAAWAILTAPRSSQ